MIKVEEIIRSMTRWTSYVGQVALFLAMAVVVANIILRAVWRPLPGTVEMSEILGAILLALGVAHCAISDGHISVDFFVSKLSIKLRAIVDSITALIALIFLSALSWQSIQQAARMFERGVTTAHLKIPSYPVGYLVAFGFVMLAIVLLLNFVKTMLVIVKGSEN